MRFSKMTALCALVSVMAVTCLGACSADLGALASDPATASVHQVVQTPAWSITTDITRVNSAGTAASASASGVTVNVPTGSVVNPGPAKSSPASSTSTTPASSGAGVTIAQPSQAAAPN